MAFLFGNTMAAMDEKENIFDPTTNAGGGQLSNDVPYSSVAGASGGAPAQNGPTPAKGQGSGGSYRPQEAQAAFQSLAAPNVSPVTDKLKNSQKTADTKLDADADAYTQTAKNQAAGYQLSDDQLNGAVGGDGKAFEATAQRLGKTQRDAIGGFSGLKKEDEPENVDYLGYENLWGDIYRGNGASATGYSSGENLFNSLLLGQSGEFRDAANQLTAGRDALKDKSRKLATDRTAEANTYLDKAYTDATADIRGRLSGLGDKVIASAKEREAAEEQRRAGLDRGAINQQKFDEIAAQIRSELTGTDQERALALLASSGDLSQFLNYDTDVDWRELLTDDDVGRYNRSQSLLGNAGQLTKSATGAGHEYSFDAEGAKRLYKEGIIGERDLRDRNARSEIDTILGRAGQRASQAYDPQKPWGNVEAYLKKTYLDSNEGQDQLTQQREQRAFAQVMEKLAYDDAMTEAAVGPIARKAYTKEDMINGAEAERLNQLQRELGYDPIYQAGSGPPVFNGAYFDKLFKDAYAGLPVDHPYGPGTPVTKENLRQPRFGGLI